MLPPRLLPERLLRMPLHLMELRILLLCLPTLLLATTLEPGEFHTTTRTTTSANRYSCSINASHFRQALERLLQNGVDN